MKNSGIGKNVVLSALGLAVLITGLVLAKLLPDAQGIMRALPYVCIGIGAGLFGGNLGAAIGVYLLKKDPNAAKQKEIEVNDERNIVISNKAKAKAYDLMLMVFAALTLAFALMQADVYIILTIIVAYLFIVVYFIYYLAKYQKEM
jgi:uncharacterized membrane protein